jgi:hypothetical protein
MALQDLDQCVQVLEQQFVPVLGRLAFNIISLLGVGIDQPLEDRLEIGRAHV